MNDYRISPTKGRKNLKSMVKDGVAPIGVGVTIPSPMVAELAAAAGFDFIWIDLEHNLINPENVANIARAADAAGIATTVRMAQMDLVLPLLDFGVTGFTFPHVRSAEQTRKIVDEVKFAPTGRRGFSPAGRAMAYGTAPFEDYLKKAEDEISIWIMLEDKEGLENCEEILAVDGIDYMFMGPGDLAQALGHINNVAHPDCREARLRLIAAAEKAGIPHEFNGAPLVVGTDRDLLYKNMKATVKATRESLASRTEVDKGAWPPV